MKNLYTAFILSFLTILSVFGQKDIPSDYQLLKPLSSVDSMMFTRLPVLTLPESFKGPDAILLPPVVDNSQSVHWRPVFNQSGMECGQASGIGLHYTYEMARIRNVDATLPDNQYPTHFVWNFGNGGEGWYGVSSLHSYQIVKTNGTPNVTDYGGSLTFGGPSRWMSGYDEWYNGMHNRISGAYAILGETEEGIITLKNWIHNHLEGSDKGGCGTFYSQAPYGMETLPSGTPEEGKYVMVHWGSSANHSMTICGYNDSIRWDYNNDGNYTNHIDINGDGMVDPKDWEIGGLKFANTYGGGPNWGNSGFCYMMYKTLADNSTNGGIWNHQVNIVQPKENCEPRLTMRVVLKDDCRETISVKAGMSTHPNAVEPTYILDYPFINFQGGCKYMQGGTTEADKTLEFGLDITPFLNLIEPGEDATYFLRIEEKDPSNWATGTVVSFSLIDYTNGINEIFYPEQNVPVEHNAVTLLGILHTVNYADVDITTDELPDATVFSPYTFQLEATGGQDPYIFTFDQNFTETVEPATFPMVTAEQLSVSNVNNGSATKTIDFDFPFFGMNYDQITVYVDGYIRFGNLFDWPYSDDDWFLAWTYNRYISPMQGDLKLNSGDGIWYEGNQYYATFRWKASVNNQAGSSLNFAIRIYASGNIEFYYGNMVYNPFSFLCGTSAGDNLYYQFLEYNGDDEIPANTKIKLDAYPAPPDFSITPNGLMTGMPMQTYEEYPVKFKVTDQDGISSSKILLLSTDGTNYLYINSCVANSGNNQVIEYGETASLTVTVKNLGSQVVNSAIMKIMLDDPYIEITDSLEFLGNFNPGEIKTFTDAFTFNVSTSIPDSYDLPFATLITTPTGDVWASSISLQAFAPVLNISGIAVDDGNNGGLEPGETADIIISMGNSGGASLSDIVASITTANNFITLNSATFNLDEIEPYGSGQLIFNLTASELIPLGNIVDLSLNLNGGLGYQFSGQVFLLIGQASETFETGNFTSFDWQHGGDAEWMIDNTVPYQGTYCATSGNIGDNQGSELFLEICVLTQGEISFYRKVSSEDNYDYLYFTVDGVIKGSWEGEVDWDKVTYEISPGVHTLKWSYEKDVSVSTGFDCAWVDFITFPPFGDPDPQMMVSPGSFEMNIHQNELKTDTLYIINTGNGPLVFDIAITESKDITWLSLSNTGGGINPGETFEVILNYDATAMAIGDYTCSLVITDHMQNQTAIPVAMSVFPWTGFDIYHSPAGISISPNPFNESVSVFIGNESGSNGRINITDVQGKVLFSTEFTRMDEKGLLINWNGRDKSRNMVEPGIYFLKLMTDKGSWTAKLIKQ